MDTKMALTAGRKTEWAVFFTVMLTVVTACAGKREVDIDALNNSLQPVMTYDEVCGILGGPATRDRDKTDEAYTCRRFPQFYGWDVYLVPISELRDDEKRCPVCGGEMDFETPRTYKCLVWEYENCVDRDVPLKDGPTDIHHDSGRVFVNFIDYEGVVICVGSGGIGYGEVKST
jgi:hypothetical protein